VRNITVLLFALFIGIGCSTLPEEAFHDHPIVWKVDDAQNIREPKNVKNYNFDYHAKGFVTRRLTRLMELHDEEPAGNTNALDEVPDSTWFTNRISRRTISPQEAATGSNVSGPPKLPLRIYKGKSKGFNPGFFALDNRGIKYLVKFDPKKNPELQTSAGAIVNRIFWTLGYHVPSDHVFNFCKKDLSIDPKAMITNKYRNKVPLKWKDINKVLKMAARQRNGCYRAISSEILKGKPKGGYRTEGVRKDDLNDTVPHQHRRDVRALKVFSAWVNHTDMTMDNTLDMYVTENGKKFLKHHLIDFTEAFGGHRAEKGRNEHGWSHWWDYTYQPLSALTLGFWKRPSEYEKPTRWKSVGTFSADPFKPKLWREAWPYFPFFETDATDSFWAAKNVMKFTNPMLQAIVKQGKLSNKRAEAHIIKTLTKRRDIIGKTFFEDVTPLDNFTITSKSICADDLSVKYGFEKSGTLKRLSEKKEVRVGRSGKVCFPLSRKKGYVRERLRIERNGNKNPVMQLHYINDSNPRIVGLIRDESQY